MSGGSVQPCIGVDPSPTLLEKWGLPVTAAGAQALGEIAVQVASSTGTPVKFQMGYFEAFGSAGLHALERVLGEAAGIGVRAIVDCKRNDIGPTMEAYARAYFGPSAPMRCAGITVNAYLGVMSQRPVIERAAQEGAVVWVVTASSNPEGERLQFGHPPGAGAADLVAEGIAKLNDVWGHGDYRPVGAVLGATLERERLARLIDMIDGAPVLAPGVGAQGADPQSVRAAFTSHRGELLVPVSRSLWADGGGANALAQRVAMLRRDLGDGV